MESERLEESCMRVLLGEGPTLNNIGHKIANTARRSIGRGSENEIHDFANGVKNYIHSKMRAFNKEHITGAQVVKLITKYTRKSGNNQIDLRNLSKYFDPTIKYGADDIANSIDNQLPEFILGDDEPSSSNSPQSQSQQRGPKNNSSGNFVPLDQFNDRMAKLDVWAANVSDIIKNNGQRVDTRINSLEQKIAQAMSTSPPANTPPVTPPTVRPATQQQ
jgi:hypothetical protein